MKKLITYILLVFGLGGTGFYVGLPTINHGFYGLPLLITLIIGSIYFLDVKFQKQSRFRATLLIALCLSFGYLTLVPLFTSWALFKSAEYRNLIGEVNNGDDFATHVAPISTEEIRIVDKAMAYKLGDKVLGTKPSLGSQVNLGDFNIQKVNGKLYWVAPLLHSGFFKWFNNRQGTNGYVMVSATNERDVKLVQNINDHPVLIKYQPAAFMAENLARHIYFNGYMTKGFTDFTFELDDQGKPYWVVTLLDKKIGFEGADATGVITVATETGEIKEYSINKAPLWIDRIQPENFVLNQLNDWGEFVRGYWNFSNQDKLTTTQGISLVYGSDNKSYWYTGLTSVGKDQGTVGFALVDTRTKETVWYKQVGATEQAAQNSAMGKVQEKRYVSSFPITYNINGIPTYVMSLKDQAGLIKMLAMVSVEDYTIVGVGNNMKEALREFKNALNSRGNAIVPSSAVQTFDITTTVSKIASDIRNGNTHYYLILKNYENKIFIGSSLVSNELPVTQVNDKVQIKYDDGANEVVDIISFDNLEIDLQKTNKQEKIEKYFDLSSHN
ncbi:hypothetical protein AAG747_27120 [Rapidithrix thailandica]|uniref:Cell shape-determining protein n=1 Tax=Rapidithrix thailandica TaxID=413964 RepID=A0AAW9SLJ1_9BACT